MAAKLTQQILFKQCLSWKGEMLKAKNLEIFLYSSYHGNTKADYNWYIYKIIDLEIVGM